MKSIRFTTGYFEFEIKPEKAEMFLSLTPDLSQGPGIHRDGITEPMMLHPAHRRNGRAKWTNDANEQRAKSLTFYHHFKKFNETLGKKWKIVGAQGFGDLTMNLWHLAILNDKRISKNPIFARLDVNLDPDFREEWCRNKYTALIVNKNGSVSCNEVTFVQGKTNDQLPIVYFDDKSRDMKDQIKLLLIGKPIVRNNKILPLQTTVNMFQDIRHIFACIRCDLPYVAKIYDRETSSIVFGEKDLFNEINKRRQALKSAIQIDLQLTPAVRIESSTLQKALKKDGYLVAEGSTPERPGQYKILQNTHGGDEKIDIYFKRNFYPFSAIGLKQRITKDQNDIIVGLCSTGQQFRIGDTIEGIAQKMAEYANCSDAMIMDEGFDVFQLVNMKQEKEVNMEQEKDIDYKFTNEDILKITAQRMIDLLEEDERKAKIAKKKEDPYVRLNEIEGNPDMIQDIKDELINTNSSDLRQKADELFPVKPQRFQTRALLIFAVKKESKISDVSCQDKDSNTE